VQLVAAGASASLKKPAGQAAQPTPPYPAVQRLQAVLALLPVLSVVEPVVQLVQSGLGVPSTPPADQLPLGQIVQVAPPKPGKHTAQAEAAVEVLAAVV
jgi:hypothetical protein